MLFEPIRIGSVTLPNRIAKSAMAEGRCDSSGAPTAALVRLYEAWARGGVGLCISGMAHLRRGHGFTGHEIGLYDDRLISPLTQVTEAVHRHGGKIFAQLCWAAPQLPRHAAKRLGATAPSAGFNKTNLLFDRALTERELLEIADDFGQASRRARAAGFDGVQLHAAHGYLLSRMLSPKHNRRTDRWGGSFEGRLSFLRTVYDRVRAEAGDDFPLTVKLNVHDGEPDGMAFDTGLAIARAIAHWGFDALEVSAGTGDVGLGCYPNKGGIPLESGARFLREHFPALKLAGPMLQKVLAAVQPSVAFPGEAYFEPLARQVAASVDIPVLCVGGIRTLARAERLLRESRIALVSLGRPLVREPDLAERWRAGTSREARCTSCNECFVHLGFGEPLACHASS